MWAKSILSVLCLVITVTLAVPANYDSSASDENGLVYVFNIYAVKNTKTKDVGRLLNDKAMFKVPANFEPVGSVLLADTDADEPFTMAEFAEFLEDMGVIVEKMNDEEDARVIEVKLDMSLEDFDDFVSLEELVKVLEAEGILLDVAEENGARVLRVEFDETKKNVEEQPFTLEELGEFFEKEGFSVDFVEVHGTVKAIKVRFEEAPDEPEEPPRPKTALEQKPEREENKIVKNDENKKKIEDRDQFSGLDFTTKSEALNKIRRRRAAAGGCPECKAANAVRAFMNYKK